MTSLLKSFKSLATPGTLRQLWSYLRNVPGGGRLLGALIGRMAPYTGTIRPEIVALDQGYSKVRIQDTRRVRNHLNCVHAIALMNLGEATTGIAVMYSLPDGMRGIITKLSMEYVKKARGPITGECRVEVPQVVETRELELSADLLNEAGEVVARAHAKWRVGPS